MSDLSMRQDSNPERVTIRLLSTSLVHTPGIVRWAQAGWLASRGKPRAALLQVMQSYGLPAGLATKLLGNELAHRVEGDAVVFEVSAADARRIRVPAE